VQNRRSGLLWVTSHWVRGLKLACFGNIKWILFDLLGESLMEPLMAPLMEVEEMSAAVILVHQLVDGQHIAIQ